MFSILALVLSLLGATPAAAQGCGQQNPNCIVPTAPVGTSNGQAASTEFVHNEIGTNLPLPNGQFFVGNISNIATAVTLSGDCTATNAGVITCTRINGVTWPSSGTSGGVPYFNSGTTVASSGVLSANNPVLGGGAGGAPTSGTRSGNTTSFATTSGSLTNNNCARFDASGNLVDAGAPCGNVVQPETFGATCGGGDDAAAFNSAISALSGAGGGTLLLSCDYNINSAVALIGNLKIIGNGRASIVAPGSGAILGLFSASVTVQTGTISSNAALFDRQLVLTSATNFTTGRLISITKTVGGGVFYSHVAQILSVASNTIQITPPMPFALLTSDTYTLRVFTPLENISIENVTFEGSNNASATRGVILQQTRNLTLNNVRFQNFVGAAGAYIDEGLGTQLSNLTAFNSGTGSEAAFNIRAQTDISALGIRDRLSTGFGQLWFMITYGNMAQLSSNRAGLGVASAGRGVKFDGCLYSTMDQIEGNDSGSTGVAITLGSNFNVFSNIVALRNRAGSPSNDIGLWFDGTSSDNLINGVIAKNNLTADLFIPTGSNRNVILNADVDTMSDGGTAQIGGIDNLVFGKKTLGLVLAGWVNVDFNSANTDFPITLVLPSKRFRFETIFVINTGTTASLTTARGGLFTAAAGGGTALVADQALAAITSNTVAVSANNLAVGSANTGWWDTTTPTVFWRTSTAQGAAATGRVFVYIRPMPG